MFTKEDVEEARKLMKKFKAKGALIQLPNGRLYSLNFKTGKTFELPDGKEVFDIPTS